MSETPPPKRPVWVVVLALAMLTFGGNLLLGGIAPLRGMGDAGGGSVFSQAVVRELREVTQAVLAAHPVAVRVNAASKVAMGLVMLFAVAAVFSSDPRGRRASLVAAWLGIGYQVGDALFVLVVARQGLFDLAAILAPVMASQSPGMAVPSTEDVASLLRLVVVMLGALGIGFSVVLLAYFGGRKGRLFYGLERQPHHGA
jgi:hypothetical protein